MDCRGFLGAWLLGAAAIPASVSAAQEPQLSEEQVKALFQDAMVATEAKLFRPGPQVADWNKGGIDLRAAVASKPGGLAANYLVNVDKDEETSVAIFSSAPAATFVPANWKRLWRFGNIDAVEPDGFLEIGNVDGPYYFVVRGSSKRLGSSFCSSGPAGGEIYQAPGDEGADTMPAGMVLLMFQAALQMTAKYTVCEKYEASGTGYAVRYYLEDGRSLPGMDEGREQLSIVPALPVGELLKPKAR